MENDQMNKIEALLESFRESGSVAFQDIAGWDDVIVEIHSFSPLIPSTWNGPAEGGEVEIILYNESGENITSHVYEAHYDDYLRIKDTAYNVATAFMEEDDGY